jgi:hypothetical protein
MYFWSKVALSRLRVMVAMNSSMKVEVWTYLILMFGVIFSA